VSGYWFFNSWSISEKILHIHIQSFPNVSEIQHPISIRSRIQHWLNTKRKRPVVFVTQSITIMSHVHSQSELKHEKQQTTITFIRRTMHISGQCSYINLRSVWWESAPNQPIASSLFGHLAELIFTNHNLTVCTKMAFYSVICIFILLCCRDRWTSTPHQMSRILSYSLPAENCQSLLVPEHENVTSDWLHILGKYNFTTVTQMARPAYKNAKQ